MGPRLGGAPSEAFASVVLVNTGVLLGYRWHKLARLWRTPVVGDVMMASLRFADAE